MTFVNYPVYYATFPENRTEVDIASIISLKNILKDFDFVPTHNHYAFIYKYLNVLISRSGAIQLSLISTNNLAQDLDLLAQLAIKINMLIGIKNYSGKFIA